MDLKVLLPGRVAYEGPVTKVSARGREGAFTILPRHIDYVTALVPGLLFFDTEGGQELFMAVDEGILVKCGSEITVSTHNAVVSDDLREVDEKLEELFQELDERERHARWGLSRLWVDFVRRYFNLEEEGHG